MAPRMVNQKEQEVAKGLNKEEGEGEEGTTIDTLGVGDSIADINRLVSFVRFTREFSPGKLSLTNLEKVVEVIEVAGITYSSLEGYVNRTKNASAPFTQTKAKQLHRELNTCIDRSKNKQTKKTNKQT